MLTRSLIISAAVGALVALSACTDSGSTTPPAVKTASLSFGLKSAAGMGVTPDFAPDIMIGSPNDTLDLQSAQLVLDHIEVAQGASATCGDSEDACDDMELGPVLVDLPLNGLVATDLSVPLTAGTYSKLEFKLRAPTGDDNNVVQFLQAHPDFAGVSVKVTGTFDGAPFTYTSQVNAGVELEFNPPVTIDSTNNNVTVSVDISKWFTDGAGVLIDPSSANAGGANEAIVNTHIEQSFTAFQDDNRDGRGDGDGSDSTGTGGNDSLGVHP